MNPPPLPPTLASSVLRKKESNLGSGSPLSLFGRSVAPCQLRGRWLTWISLPQASVRSTANGGRRTMSRICHLPKHSAVMLGTCQDTRPSTKMLAAPPLLSGMVRSILQGPGSFCSQWSAQYVAQASWFPLT